MKTYLFLTSSLIFALFNPAAVFAGDSDATSGKSVQINDADPFEDNLLGDWGGVRSTLADQGVTVNLDGNYSFQGVANGGLRRGSDYGNVFSGNLGIL
ncbi:MAG: hypothetical protein KDL87_02945, partial [Verrucomicrobiae bacterium]|nr:hypothetical protein [Verrucomicrobiae bacterium]